MPSGSLEGGLRTVMVFFRHISSWSNITTLWQFVKAGLQAGHDKLQKPIITKS